MIVLVGAFLISMIPVLGMYFWLKTRAGQNDPESYKQLCRKGFMSGILSTFLVIPMSGIIALTLSLLGLRDGSSLLASALHDFIVLAFSEEVVKSVMFYRLMKKAEYDYSWLDMTALMVIVSIGFEVLESLIYAFGTDAIQMLVRGITLMHGGYGFIEGYFYGMAAYTKKKWYAVIGFLISWILHGSFDFGLSEDFVELSENAVLLSVSLALLALVFVVVMIIFFGKKKKKAKYLEPLHLYDALEEEKSAEKTEAESAEKPASDGTAPSDQSAAE